MKAAGMIVNGSVPITLPMAPPNVSINTATRIAKTNATPEEEDLYEIHDVNKNCAEIEKGATFPQKDSEPILDIAYCDYYTRRNC